MKILEKALIPVELIRWNIRNMINSHFRLQEHPLYLNDIRNNISITKFFKNTFLNIFYIYNIKKGYILHVTDFNSIGLIPLVEKLEDLGAKQCTIEFCNFYRKKRNNTGPFFLANIEQSKKIFNNLEKFKSLKKDFAKKGKFSNIMKNLDNNYIKNEQKTKDQKFTYQNPTHVFVELTQNCNLSCRMCGRQKEKFSKEREMDFNLFKKIGKQIFKKGVYVDLRGYGESTYYSKFPEVIDFCKNFDSEFGIVTNLTTQNKNILKKMIEENFWIQISFDGATKATFEYIRRGSKFENIIENLQFISEYKKKIKSTSRIEFIITIQGDNIDELMDICKIAVKYHLNRVVFNAVVTNENDPNNLKFHQEKVQKNVPKAIEYIKKHNIDTQIISTFGIKKLEKSIKIMKKCPRPHKWIYIDYTGRMGPCNHFMERDYTFGKISMTHHDILQERNNLAFQFLRSVINTKYRLSSCEYCFEKRYDY